MDSWPCFHFLSIFCPFVVHGLVHFLRLSLSRRSAERFSSSSTVAGAAPAEGTWKVTVALAPFFTTVTLPNGIPPGVGPKLSVEAIHFVPGPAVISSAKTWCLQRCKSFDCYPNNADHGIRTYGKQTNTTTYSML